MDKIVTGALTAALLLFGTGAVSAQSAYGDNNLAYSDGVVYDDDLVPGRSVNQSFITDPQSGGGSVSSGARFVPAPSRNLIGSDGRAIDEIRSSRARAVRRSRAFRPNQ